jgi:hypothetical protein
MFAIDDSIIFESNNFILSTLEDSFNPDQISQSFYDFIQKCKFSSNLNFFDLSSLIK